jgi:hypothetical protein
MRTYERFVVGLKEVSREFKICHSDYPNPTIPAMLIFPGPRKFQLPAPIWFIILAPTLPFFEATLSTEQNVIESVLWPLQQIGGQV